MHVAILCSGPCLREYLDDPVPHDVRIAVNQVATAIPVDYWVCNDSEAWDWWTAAGDPMCVTLRGTHARITDKSRPRRWLFLDDVNTACPSDTNWRQLSITCALVLAEHVGAAEVSLYGCNWAGNETWNGEPEKISGRNHYRWSNEQHWVGQVCKWLRSRGIPVRRFINGAYEQV